MSAMSDVRQTLFDFLGKYSNEISEFTNVPIENTGLLTGHEKNLGLTQFHDLYDTLLYSKLIGDAIDLSHSPELVIDLGAGSSLPTILALKQKENKNLRVVALDIDPEALQISEQNVIRSGLLHQYHFMNGSIDEGLEKYKKFKNCVFASNPPYIAAPEDVSDYFFLPINGGEDGTKYLDMILNSDFTPETTLAIFWGSLTNPIKVISQIEKRFDVLQCRSAKVHFGIYTSESRVRGHLQKLKDEGKVYFETNAENVDLQWVIGTVLRPKSSLQNQSV